MRSRSGNQPRPSWRKIKKRLDPFVRLLVASYTLKYVKGGRGSNISELSFVTNLKSSKVSALLRMMGSKQLVAVLEVKIDISKGLAKNYQKNFRVHTVLPKSQLNRAYLRDVSRSRGSLGKLYLISLRTDESLVPVLEKLKTVDLRDLLRVVMPLVIKYLRNCNTFEYKLMKHAFKIAIRSAYIVVQRAADLYEDVGFVDDRVLVLRHMEKILDTVKTGSEKIRRRRELLNALECCQRDLKQWSSLPETGILVST